MIHTEHIVKRFADIGAKLHVGRTRREGLDFTLDVDRNRKLGEHFVLLTTPNTPTLHVQQADRAARHLLLSVGTSQFLCGHDERHWFAATMRQPVMSITAARRALLPAELVDRVNGDQLARRSSPAFKRQGEWFFVPTNKIFPDTWIHYGEPIRRNGRSKPHRVDQVVRFGGQRVVLHGGNEYTESNWAALERTNPDLRGKGQRQVKEPEFYARGKVRHPDHETINLEVWHRVYPNREGGSANLTFYD